MLLRPKTSTFSIVGFDPKTKELGVAVQSKFLAVGSVVPFVEIGVGAIATQSWANPFYGSKGLKLLKEGKSPAEVISILTREDEGAQLRQVGIVDSQGRAATFTGDECYDWAGGVTGENFAAQGNILVNAETVTDMADTFQKESGALADRLLKALEAGQKAGGDKRGQQSAALLVYRDKGGYGGMDKYIDLRVDDDSRPIEKLAELLDLFYLYFTDRDAKNIPLTDAVLKEVQQLLKNMNYYQGPITATVDSEFEKSLFDFYNSENFEERIPEGLVMPEDILNYLRQRGTK